MIAMEEVYFSVDVESSGPIPGEYSLLSLGSCLVVEGRLASNEKFYRELKPLNANYVPRALEVSGLDMTRLVREGMEPVEAMADFEDWILERCGHRRPIFLAFNATFDWSFVNWYFHMFLGKNPFGISGLDIKAYSMGKLNLHWGETTKWQLNRRFRTIHKHTHNALDDAVEQAELFNMILRSQSNQ